MLMPRRCIGCTSGFEPEGSRFNSYTGYWKIGKGLRRVSDNRIHNTKPSRKIVGIWATGEQADCDHTPNDDLDTGRID